MNFADIIKQLDEKGHLAQVKSEVDPVHELAGIAKAMEGGEKAVIFENVKGMQFPVVCGIWWNRDIIGAMFDTPAADVPAYFGSAVKSFKANPVEPIIVEDAPCQEVVSLEPNLYELTVPTLALEDGGPYFSNSVIIAKDPDTGVRNTSIHRVMISGKDHCCMLMDMGRHLRSYYERAEAKGEPLEITINNGVDPAVYVSAIAGGTAITEDELGVAAALRGEPVMLSRSKTVSVEGIAEAQVVIEARIMPSVREPEGPFGEVSGYYAQRADRWVVEVSAITRRENPVMHTLLPGKEVWNSIGTTSEADILSKIQAQVPGVKNVYLTHGNCATYGAVVQMEPVRPGMGKLAMMAAFAAMPPMKMVTVVNSDIDIFDTEEVMRAITTRCDPAKDMVIIPNAALHELNPCTDMGFGTKIGFDCTVHFGEEARNKKVGFASVVLDDYDIS